MIQSIRNPAAQSKRQRHPRRAHTQRDPPVADQQPEINLQSHQEEEKDQADIGSRREGRHGGSGEDGVGEARNAAEDGGAEQDAADDFGDDTGLAEFLEGQVEEAAEDCYDTSLRT